MSITYRLQCLVIQISIMLMKFLGTILLTVQVMVGVGVGIDFGVGVGVGVGVGFCILLRAGVRLQGVMVGGCCS